MKEISIQALWTPDAALAAEVDVPTTEQLAVSWNSLYGPSDILHLDEQYYGICAKPDRQPSAIISLDLCEIVRETAISLTRIRGGGIDDVAVSEKRDYSDYGSTFNGWDGDIREKMVATVVREMLRDQQVTPVPHADAIAAFMQRWAEKGVYIIANTSSHEGCELSTIRDLGNTYPGSLRGILFPRNHDGNGAMTKANILAHAKDTIVTNTGYDLSSVPTIAVDDTAHHAIDYLNHPDECEVFMPAYGWNGSLESHPDIVRIEQTHGTVNTFMAVDQRLAELGIL